MKMQHGCTVESDSPMFISLAFFLTVRTLIICASYWQKASDYKTLGKQLTEAVWGKLINFYLPWHCKKNKL